MLGITGAENTLSKKYTFNTRLLSKAEKRCQKDSGIKKVEWGIYAKKQSAAKALASVFRYTSSPEIHGSGKYGHYHDSTHSFHIWFGSAFIYYD